MAYQSNLKIDLKKTKFSLRKTVLSHGWVNLPPYEYDYKNNILHRTEVINGNLTELLISQKENLLKVKVKSKEKLDISNKSEIKKNIHNIFQLDIDFNEFCDLTKKLNKRINHYVKAGGGRFLTGNSLFEDVVKTLFTTNTTWNQTVNMTKSFISQFNNIKYGTPMIYGFPTYCEFRKIKPKKVVKGLKLGYRNEFLENIINIFLEKNGFVDEDKITIANELNKVKGIGRYSVAHIKCLMGMFDEIPIDSEVIKYAKSKGIGHNEKQIIKYYKEYGKYAFLAYKIERIVNKINWIGQ